MRKLLLLIFLFSLSQAYGAQKQTICLNMIVKDEATVIERCLKSVKPLIDYWVIVDTGSTDVTKEIIKEYMQDVPGELHERPWVNFEHNRNEALALAKEKGDFLLFIDADEELEYSSSFVFPLLTFDHYGINIHFNESTYGRSFLANTKVPWRWEGVVHEHLVSPQKTTQAFMQGIINRSHTDGNRRKDPQRRHKDTEILKHAVEKDPTNPRNMFYLAQSYLTLGDNQNALDTYRKRSTMKGTSNETFWSLYQIGRIQENLNMPPEIFIQSYHNAYKARPSRIEPLANLAHHYTTQEDYMLGFLYAFYALSLPPNINDSLFIKPRIRNELLPLDLSICAYYIGRFDISKNVSEKLLENPDLPPSTRECVQKNIEWVNPHILLHKKGSKEEIDDILFQLSGSPKDVPLPLTPGSTQ